MVNSFNKSHFSPFLSIDSSYRWLVSNQVGAFPDVYKNLVESRGLADDQNASFCGAHLAFYRNFTSFPSKCAQEELAVIATYLPILHVLHLTMFFTSAKQMQNLRPSKQLHGESGKIHHDFVQWRFPQQMMFLNETSMDFNDFPIFSHLFRSFPIFSHLFRSFSQMFPWFPM